ncbi:MAG: hypothetical protein WAM82_02355 [Thermoanaerobaculia bacterium]
MWLSIIAIVIASLTAIVGAVTGNGTARTKRTLVALAVVGLIAGLYAAVDSDQQKRKDAQAHALEVKGLNDQLTKANVVTAEIKKAQADQDPLLRYVTASVGDLGALNALSGGRKYFVRIATASNKRGLADLEATKSRLQEEFKGAVSSGMVAIIQIPKQPGSMQLVFGRNLSFAAAEVYLRLAVSHHLANGQPQIFSESEAASPKQ